VCDATLSTCVECLANSDCAGQTGQLCAPDGVCVACLADRDCPSATPACNAGTCVQCLRNTDCASGHICFPISNTCL
jgi:Cys-rich repeat protein